MKSLAKNTFLRRVVMPILKATAFDFEMQNPWSTHAKLKLNTFQHKGYWYYRHRREEATMQIFEKLIQTGDRIIEVGGHIGFISQLFANCVGCSGEVIVFEPGENNLPYLLHNVTQGLANCEAGNVQVIQVAASNVCGQAIFYEETLTGQNNSLVEAFDGLNANQRVAGVSTDVYEHKIDTQTIDSVANGKSIRLIKIDVEGHEFEVLAGAELTIEKQRPALMVEIQANEQKIFDFLMDYGYQLFTPTGEPCCHPGKLRGNTFALQSKDANSVF